MFGVPTETRQELNGTLIGGSKMEFSIVDDIIVPKKFYGVKEGTFVKNWEATSWSMESSGKIAEVWQVDANGGFYPFAHVLSWSNGLLSAKTYGEFSSSYTYDDIRLLISMTDENGIESSFDYDDFQRLLQTITNNNEVTIDYVYEHLPNKTIATTTYEDDTPTQITTKTYDGLGLYEETTRKDNKVINSVSYDPFGRVISEYNLGANAVTKKIEPSPLGRVTEEKDGAGNRTYYTYNGTKTGENSLRAMKVRDPNGRTTTTSTDLLDRVTGVLDAMNKITTYKYDKFGRLEEVHPPAGSPYIYTYSNRDLVETKKIPGTSGKYVFDYDNRDLLQYSTDPNGNKLENEYDDYDRLLKTFNKTDQPPKVLLTENVYAAGKNLDR